MILRLITENFWWKVLSLVVAISIWLNLANEPELATIVSVPVQYENFPKDLEISSDILETIDVEAKGPSNRLRNLTDSRTAAVINFESILDPGIRTFTLTAQEVKLPRGLQLVRTIPAQLRFTFERRAEKSVPVEVACTGKLPAGLKSRGIDIYPPRLNITGPASHVERTNVLRTDPCDYSRIPADPDRDPEQTLTVFIEQPQVRLSKDASPQVRVRIHLEQVPH